MTEPDTHLMPSSLAAVCSNMNWTASSWLHMKLCMPVSTTAIQAVIHAVTAVIQAVHHCSALSDRDYGPELLLTKTTGAEYLLTKMSESVKGIFIGVDIES